MIFRPITALILLVAFAAQTFQQAAIVFSYYADTPAFARNCENKARPMLHCNGQCQMMKKLRAEERKDQQNPERKAGRKDEAASCRSYFASLTTVRSGTLPSSVAFPTAALPCGAAPGIFHPPTMVSFI